MALIATTAAAREESVAPVTEAGCEGRKFAQSIAAGQTPLRITETPRWVEEHRKVRARLA